jgi:hypothetical protein
MTMRSTKKMMERTGLPTECKILKFPERKPQLLTTWGDLTGDYSAHCVTSALIAEPFKPRCVAEVFAELMDVAVTQSVISGVSVYVLAETAIRRHTGLSVPVAKLLTETLRALRSADEAQRDRLNP